MGGLSLDRVVRKAAELEHVLSSCKARAAGGGEGEGGRGGERVLADRECWAPTAKETNLNTKYGGKSASVHYAATAACLVLNVVAMTNTSLCAYKTYPTFPSFLAQGPFHPLYPSFCNAHLNAVPTTSGGGGCNGLAASDCLHCGSGERSATLQAAPGKCLPPVGGCCFHARGQPLHHRDDGPWRQ